MLDHKVRRAMKAHTTIPTRQDLRQGRGNLASLEHWRNEAGKLGLNVQHTPNGLAMTLTRGDHVLLPSVSSRELSLYLRGYNACLEHPALNNLRREISVDVDHETLTALALDVAYMHNPEVPLGDA